MIACNEIITLIKHTTENDGDSYECTAVNDASWFAKTVITTSGDGAKPANTYEVRVMGYGKFTPAPGDYVARGVVANISKPSDLKGVEHFRITAVGDNRRGSLPHWRLTGA